MPRITAIGAPIILALGLVSLAVYSVAQPASDVADAAPALLKRAPAETQPGDDELTRLLKARYNEALAELDIREKHMAMGRGEFTHEAADRLVEAGLELFTDPGERMALLEQHLTFAKQVEEQARLRFEVGAGSQEALHTARYYRLDAEIRLLRTRQEAGR